MLNYIIKYWLEILFTLISSGIAYIFKQYISLKHGMKSLLKAEIIKIYDKQITSGVCPNYMKENIKEMYDNYHKLGGNGFITSLVNKIYDLPSKGDDINEKESDIINN